MDPDRIRTHRHYVMEHDKPDLDRKSGALRVDRAIFELLRGRAIEVQDPDGTSVVASLDRLHPSDLRYFIAADDSVNMLIMRERGRTLGFNTCEAATLVECRAVTTLQTLLELATGHLPDIANGNEHFRFTPADARGDAAVALARYAQIAPGARTTPIHGADR